MTTFLCDIPWWLGPFPPNSLSKMKGACNDLISYPEPYPMLGNSIFAHALQPWNCPEMFPTAPLDFVQRLKVKLKCEFKKNLIHDLFPLTFVPFHYSSNITDKFKYSVCGSDSNPKTTPQTKLWNIYGVLLTAFHISSTLGPEDTL